MTKNGTASCTPLTAHPGHHDLVVRNVTRAWKAPSARPPAQAIPTELRRPSSATASAGTTAHVKMTGLSPTAGEASVTTRPPSALEPAHTIAASRSGE